jgi:hypothetical protein
MEIEILKQTPKSGKFKEIHFGENFNSCLWVDFYISDENHWLGCFSKLYENGIDKFVYDKSSMLCLIVSGGKGYLINIENGELIYNSEEYPLVQSVTLSIQPNYFFIGTFYCVFVINTKGFLKEIRPDFMVDGIYLEKQEGNKIIGTVESAENQYNKRLDISIDIDTLEFDPLKKSSFNIFKNLF